jgi:hypothetical protein
MMRIVWFLFVPGELFAVIWWALIAAGWLCFWIFDISEAGAFNAAIDAVIALLNLYSWDFQRRQRDGGAS